MYGIGPDDLLNQPGDHPGARRVRRLGPAHPGVLVLETWNGERWVNGGYTNDNNGIRAWITGNVRPGEVTPWTPGTGRRRRPDNARTW